MKILSEKLTLGAALLAVILIGAPQNSSAQTESALPTPASTLPANIPPNSPLAQVVQMAQSGVDESVIVGFINNSSAPFNLTSDQIIYLKDLGLPNDAVMAMMQRDQQLNALTTVQTPSANSIPPTEVATEAPGDVTQNYFYDTLSPYGGWVNVAGYGLCWRPTIVIYNPDWQPYCQHGHWVYTDAGWYWISDYAWGSCTFHYGRWFRDAHQGWCWWPDTTWGPSWVCWRYSNDYCGWAPLPPHTIYRDGVGMVYDGTTVSADFNFGLGANSFTFVPTKDFCDPHPERFRLARARTATIYNHTTIINNFSVNNHDHTFINNGIAPEKITAASRTPIARLSIRATTVPGARGAERSGNTLVINRPHIQANAVSILNRGVRPSVVRQNTPRPLILNGNGNNFRNATPEQNDFSSPMENQNSRGVTPQSQERQNFYPPIQTPDYDGNRRAMSPKRQQFEEQSSGDNYRNSDQRAIPAEPVEHPQANPSRPSAPPAPAPSQNSDKDRNGH